LLSTLLRWISGKVLTVDSATDSATYMARVHGMDRRRHTRIRLPAVATPAFPELRYNNIALPIVDLSVGGACIKDLKESLSGEVGHMIRMQLWWPGGEQESLDVRVVAASRHFNRHLHFQSLGPASLTRLSMLVRCGSAGYRMRMAPMIKSGPAQLQAVELWTGVNGDSLAFFDTGEKFAELSCCATTIAFFSQFGPRVISRNDSTHSRPAKPIEVADALVCLVNIEGASPRVLKLIEILTSRAHQWMNTGSGV
jgi:hypothetical protein